MTFTLTNRRRSDFDKRVGSGSKRVMAGCRLSEWVKFCKKVFNDSVIVVVITIKGSVALTLKTESKVVKLIDFQKEGGERCWI